MKNKESKLIKVVLEYNDKIQILEGEEARSWLESINSNIVFNYIHGIEFPKYDWKIVLKK